MGRALVVHDGSPAALPIGAIVGGSMQPDGGWEDGSRDGFDRLSTGWPMGAARPSRGFQEAAVLRASGDQMAPTIRHGDLLVVDMACGRLVDGNLYAFVMGASVIVRRVQRLALGGLVLISDSDPRANEAVSEGDIAGLPPHGRVLWYGRAA